MKLESSGSAYYALRAFFANMAAFWAFGGQTELSGPNVSVAADYRRQSKADTATKIISAVKVPSLATTIIVHSINGRGHQFSKPRRDGPALKVMSITSQLFLLDST
jgi:hypothetical protein